LHFAATFCRLFFWKKAYIDNLAAAAGIFFRVLKDLSFLLKNKIISKRNLDIEESLHVPCYILPAFLINSPWINRIKGVKFAKIFVRISTSHGPY
jgi:hypothetical protein